MTIQHIRACTFGYAAPKTPCRICGGFKNNQSEPRFGYVVCEDHQNVPPTKIPPEQKP